MARKIKVDFTDVESYVKCEEGQHIVQLKEIEEKQSQGGNEMLAVKFEVTNGACTGAVVYEHFVLNEKSLWKLKNYLEIINVKADGKVALDIDKLIGKKCIVEVKHEEYNGAIQARIVEFKKLAAKAAEPEDDEEYEEEEEEEIPVPKKKVKKKPEPEPEEEEEEEEEEDEEDEPAPPPKKKKTPPAPAKKPAAKKKPAPVEEEEEDDEWEEA
jgi:hypothetical protein